MLIMHHQTKSGLAIWKSELFSFRICKRESEVLVKAKSYLYILTTGSATFRIFFTCNMCKIWKVLAKELIFWGSLRKHMDSSRKKIHINRVMGSEVIQKIHPENERYHGCAIHPYIYVIYHFLKRHSSNFYRVSKKNMARF